MPAREIGAFYVAGDGGLAIIPRRMLQRLKSYAQRLADQSRQTQVNRSEQLLGLQLRTIFLVARWDVYDRLKLHAQALTYDTLLALVPLLAVTMAVVKGFGGMGPVADRLQDLIVSNISVAPEMQQAVGEQIRTFVLTVQTGSMSIISVLILVVSTLSLLGHIEFAFNVIFGATTRRPLTRRFLIYWGILTLGPLLLGATFALSAAVNSTEALQSIESLSAVHALLIRCIPLMATWLAFTAIYLLVPMRHVRLAAALPAAVIAGSLWQIGKHLYAIYARNAFALHNLYGSLATIPLFILWLYVSWLLVLFGGQLAFALQHAGTYRRQDSRQPPHQAARELASCRIFLAIAEDFCMGRPASERDSLAQRLGLPIQLVETLVLHLCKNGFICETAPNHHLVPARNPEQVTVADLLQSLRHVGTSPHMVQDAATEFLVMLLGELDNERQKRAGAVNFQDLARRFAGG